MYDFLISIITSIAAISVGLMAGVYFAFSTFIMQSLDRLGAVRATDAMNSINQFILRSWFMGLFFGSTLLCVLITVIAMFDSELDGRWLLFGSGVIYVFGMFCCTACFNVPLNNRLAESAAKDDLEEGVWPYYFQRWTAWNHLRSISSLCSLILYLSYLKYYV